MDAAMNQESLAELHLSPHKWYNESFSKSSVSERPDTAAAASSILEGNIIILVDRSPPQ